MEGSKQIDRVCLWHQEQGNPEKVQEGKMHECLKLKSLSYLSLLYIVMEIIEKKIFCCTGQWYLCC